VIDRILRLGKETALYGLSTVVGRMLNFLLVPLYAHLLLPGENGVLATLYAYIAFAAVVYGLGMEQAFMRFWVEAAESDRPHILRRSAAVGLIGVLLSSTVLMNATPVALALGFDGEHAPLVRWAAVILAFDALSGVPFALLRMERRPLSFASIKIANIVATLLLTVYFVAVQRRGLSGVLFANAIASVATWATLLLVTRTSWKSAGPTKSAAPLSDLWRFGLPLIPAGLAGIALQVVDRPILRWLTDDATVGLYQINFRLGVFMMLFVGMFDFAWRPFYLQHAKDEDARPLFARIFTYLMILLASVLFVVSIFVDDLVRFPIGASTLLPELYWSGTSIIPIVLAGYIGTGMYVIFLSGTYLAKRTGVVPLIGLASATVDVIALLILVPRFGIMGAASSMAIAYAVQAGGMYRVSQRLYHVPYEWSRVIAVLAWSGGLVVLDRWIAPAPLSSGGIFFEGALVAVFVSGLLLFRIVRREELQEVLTFVRVRRRGTA
jgi:O-antigen/teichoic acid export membrane protein